MYFDHDLNLVRDTFVTIDVEWCLPTSSGQCMVGNYQSFMELNSSTLFTVGVLGHKHDSSILFSATISEDGYILDFQLDNKWLPYAYYHESYIQLLPNNETSFYL